MLLVKNAAIYAPEYLGKKDLLICGGKIECIQDSIRELPVECEVLDAEGKILTPGFLINMYISPEAVEREAFIRGHRNYRCQNW